MIVKHHPEWKFGPSMNIAWYPKFYYGGSRRRNVPSDRDWIFKHLELLGEDDQKIVSEEYEQIYLRNHNKGEFRKARLEANEFLRNFTRENYLPTKTPEPPVINGDCGRLNKKIAQVRKTQRESKPRIIR